MVIFRQIAQNSHSLHNFNYLHFVLFDYFEVKVFVSQQRSKGQNRLTQSQNKTTDTSSFKQAETFSQSCYD